MIYDTFEKIPSDYQWIVNEFIENGIIANQPRLEFPISDDLLYVLKLMIRMGLLDKKD